MLFRSVLRKKRQRGGRRLQSELASSAQHDDVRGMLEQLQKLCGLNTWVMVCTRLGPIPLAAPAGPQLGVTQTALSSISR